MVAEPAYPRIREKQQQAGGESSFVVEVCQVRKCHIGGSETPVTGLVVLVVWDRSDQIETRHMQIYMEPEEGDTFQIGEGQCPRSSDHQADALEAARQAARELPSYFEAENAKWN